MSLSKIIFQRLGRNSDKFRVANESYGDDPLQCYDVYSSPRPSKSKRRTIVFLYGGYWRFGEKRDYAYVGEGFARLGYDVLIPDYRLFPAVRHPAFTEDVAEAINHYQKHFHKQKLGELVIVAHSAGAQMGALLCYSSKYQRLLDDPQAIIGFVGIAGAYGFSRGAKPLSDIFPPTPESDWQPIAAADRFVVPALLLGAKFDRIVPSWSTIKLARTLRSGGAVARSHLFIVAEHSTLVLALRHQFGVKTAIMREVNNFVRRLPSG